MAQRMSAARLAEQREQIEAHFAELRRWYPVREDDPSGTEVRPGDEITTFRGERCRFDMVTAYPVLGKTGKITYKNLDGSTPVGGERYPSVFRLRLVRREDR